MTITAIVIIAAVVLTIKNKDRWMALVILLVAGIFLGGTDFGHGVVTNLTNVSSGLDNWIKSWVH